MRSIPLLRESNGAADMGKNILIFSDGTGQAGGLLPDEVRTNVYKLFRATRCGPDSIVDPKQQVAFYDPGIGSKSANASIKVGWLRWFMNVLCQMTGLGLTRNIVDCYAAIIDLWEPGDRIYLFGFSRGAYTARCLGGVLGLCGVPTRGTNGKLASPREIKSIAREAVKKVYQHGASKPKNSRFHFQRDDLAAAFRKKYNSDIDGVSNTVPYFIGVWDTVAALGTSIPRLILFYAIGAPIALGVLAFIAWGWTFLFGPGWSDALLNLSPTLFDRGTPLGSVTWAPLAKFFLLSTGAILILSYLWTHLKWAIGTRDPVYKTIHVVAWRLKFYDRDLNDRVDFARHAMAIDERRKDFPRVPWTNSLGVHERKTGERNWFEQIWFAGNHADIGGGYIENESRLSDITLQWMVDEARDIPHPILVDEGYLRPYPDSLGMMHDECKGSPIPWFSQPRSLPNGAVLHVSVFERLGKMVRNYDVIEAYDPVALRPEPHKPPKTFNKCDPPGLKARTSEAQSRANQHAQN